MFEESLVAPSHAFPVIHFTALVADTAYNAAKVWKVSASPKDPPPEMALEASFAPLTDPIVLPAPRHFEKGKHEYFKRALESEFEPLTEHFTGLLAGASIGLDGGDEFVILPKKRTK